jgi:predicted HTH domain antitoxin
MRVVVEIPDELAKQFAEPQDLSQRVREALAMEGYLSDRLSRGQVADLLGLNFYQAEQWFARKGLRRNYDVEDLEEDRRTLDRLLPQS